MIALLQRVRQARVLVADELVGEIAAGLMVLVCVERADSEAQCDRMLAKILKLRIFNDAAGKMNHSLQDMDGSGAVGGLLLVSQFTLAADATSNAHIAWSYPRDGAYMISPVLYRGLLYVAKNNGVFVVIDAVTERIRHRLLGQERQA